jgi:hypothetical protein
MGAGQPTLPGCTGKHAKCEHDQFDNHLGRTGENPPRIAIVAAEPTAVVAFVDAQAEFKSPATVRRYIATIAASDRASRSRAPGCEPLADSGFGWGTLALTQGEK